ncbi:MAG: sigma-70 family RNA polymerase sigma factor [Bacteroidales bacterium]|nr:sigma-70 family RNA polymerase sigma factor [Bacteroidales bacterium]
MEINPNFTEKAKRDYYLVQAALGNNDRNAYAELLSNYRDSIFFMLLKMTNNRDDAEDLTIEAFGKAFKKLDQYAPDYAFSTWLFKIATNNCIDHMRRKKQHTYSLDKDYHGEEGTSMANQVPSNSLDPEEELINSQKITIMQTLVTRLKPHYRVLIELRYFEEYTYEEISNELDLPLGTVKAKLFRARDLLNNILIKTQIGV